MIDTDKYEGHTEGPWKAFEDDADTWSVGKHVPHAYNVMGICMLHPFSENKEANAKLMADAPLLLEEVKRLRKTLESVLDTHPEGDCWCIEDDNGHRCMGCWAREMLE